MKKDLITAGQAESMKRIEREIETVGIMIDLYCRHHHGNEGRCEDCRELYLYARERLRKCPFGEEKTACGPCRIHCYRPEMGGRIRDVMKFAGPRMVCSHPLLAFWHLWMARRKLPPVGKKTKT